MGRVENILKKKAGALSAPASASDRVEQILKKHGAELPVQPEKGTVQVELPALRKPTADNSGVETSVLQGMNMDALRQAGGAIYEAQTGKSAADVTPWTPSTAAQRMVTEKENPELQLSLQPIREYETYSKISGEELHGRLYDMLQEIKVQQSAGADTTELQASASRMEEVLQQKLGQYSAGDLIQLQGMVQSQWQKRADNHAMWKKRYDNTGRSLSDDPDYDTYSTVFSYEQGKANDLKERLRAAYMQKELGADHGLIGKGDFFDRLDKINQAGIMGSMGQMNALWDKAQDIVVNGEVKLIELTAKIYGKGSPLYSSLMDMAEKMRAEAARPSRDAVELTEAADKLRTEALAGTGLIDGFIVQQMENVSSMMFDIWVAGAGGMLSGTTGTAMAPKSSTQLALRATGGGIQEAQEKGYGEIEQILYGTAVGALEWGSEQLFGGNPLYDEGKGLVPKLVEKVTDNPKILRALYSKPFGVLGEGFEEVFVEFTTPTAEYVFTSKDEIDWASPEDLAAAFAGGVFLGLIGTGVEMTTNAIGNAKTVKAYNALGDLTVQVGAVQSVIDKGLQADPITDAYQNAVKLQKKLDAGMNITAKDMGKQLIANQEAIDAGKLVDIEEVEDDPTVPEGKLQDPEDGFYAVAIGKQGDKNTYRLVQVHSDGSVEQLTVEGTDSLFGVKIAAEIQGIRVRHIGTVQNLTQIAEAKNKAAEEATVTSADNGIATPDDTAVKAESSELQWAGSEIVTPPAEARNDTEVETAAEDNGLRWAGNMPKVEEVDPLKQLRRDYAEGRITEEEFDEALELIRQEESAAEQSMVEGVQWAGSETEENGLPRRFAPRNDRVKETAAKNNNTETEDMTYGTEQTNEISDRNTERTGERSGERSGGRTKNNALRAATRRAEKAYHLRNAVRRAGVERTSLRGEGLLNGSDVENLMRVPEELWTDELRLANKAAEEAGLELVPLVGILRVNMNGKEYRVTAVICGGKIYAQADSVSMDIMEAVRHEIFHDKAERSSELVKGLMKQIAMRYSDGELQQLFGKYYDLYKDILPEDMDETDVKEYIWEEMLADAYAGYQRYPNHAEPAVWVDEVRKAVKQMETKNTADGGARMSIETLTDGKKYVRADRQVLYGNDPEAWSEQLEDYINGRIRRGQDVRLLTDDGDVLTLTSRTAGKISSRYYNDGTAMSAERFESKANAGAHIDELAQISVRGKKNVQDYDGKHGDDASEGWNYRTAYFMDFDGKYYLCTISVEMGNDGNVVYNIGKMQERSFPKISGSSVSDGAQGGETPSDISISKNHKDVNARFSAEKQAETKDTVEGDEARVSAKVDPYRYEKLTQKPPLNVTVIDDRAIPTRGKKVKSQEIANAGRNKAAILYNDVRGKQRYVYIKDLGGDVLVPKKGFEHGIQGNKTNSSTMRTAEITYDLVDILRNSIVVNELEARPGDDCDYSYILFGYAMNKDGDEYIVKSTVNHYADNKSVVDSVEIYDILKGSKAKSVASKVIGSHTGKPAARVLNALDATAISVAELLDAVKENYPELLPDSVREHFGIQDLPKEPTAKFSFAGEGALAADEASLQMAKDMRDVGIDTETIWQETGWYQGRDGKWRFEIDDSRMRYYRGGDAQFRRDHPEYARYQELELAFVEGRITENEITELLELHETWGREYTRLSDLVDRGSAKLGNILDHEELYAAYPELRNMRVVFKDLDGARGEIDHRRNTITLDNALRYEAGSTLLHEIQHAIQEVEEFAGGSSLEYWENKGYNNARERYRNTAGEIEARDVAARRSLTAEERRQRMPNIGSEDTVFASHMDKNGQAIGRTTDNRTFVEVESDILAGVPEADWVTTVKENLKKKFPNEIIIGRNEINIDGRSRKELTYSGYMQWLYNNNPTLYADKLRATDNADEILLATTDWVNEGLKHSRKDRIVDFARGSVLLRIGGNDYSAEVVVGTRKNGTMLLYDVLQLTPVSFVARETDAATSTDPSPGTARSTASVSEDSIFQRNEDVNIRFSMAGEVTAEEQYDPSRYTARDGHLFRTEDMSAEEHVALDEKWRTRKQVKPERPETAQEWIIPKERFTSTPAMEKLGIKIEGSVTRYRQTEQLRSYEKAARHSEAMAKASFRKLHPTEQEKKIAKMLVEGSLTAGMLNGEQVDLEKVLELADYIAAAESYSERMVAHRREEINVGNMRIAEEFFADSDEYAPRLKHWGILTKAVMNYREMERVCRQVFGDEQGEKIYRVYFRPVWVNGAEMNRFENRMLQRVAKFQDKSGKSRALSEKEREFAQRLMEGQAVVESFERLKAWEQKKVKNAAEELNQGKSTEEVAEELQLNGYLAGVAQAYADYMDTVELSKDMDLTIMNNAIETYRQIYNELYDAINDFMVSHGYNEIGFIKGYAPHFQKEEVQQGLLGALKKLGVEKESVSALPASIAGRTADFKPNMKWNPHTQSREGKKTDYDILVGYEQYLHYAAEMFYHTDDVMRIRQAVNWFRRKYSGKAISEALEEAQPGQFLDAEWKYQLLVDRDIVKVTEELTKKEVDEKYAAYVEELYERATPASLQKYSEFVTWMDDYANVVAGKQSYADRGLEAWGRGMLNLPQKLVRQFAISNVAGNLSSVINQTAQLPMIQRDLGWYAEKAIWDMVWGQLRKEGFKETSDFLTDKRGVERLSAAGMEKFISTLFKPAVFMDEAVTTIAVRGRYLQALHEGMTQEEAMAVADDYGRRTMGSRMKGAKPLAFESKSPIMQLLNQFQIEALNQFERATFDGWRAVKAVAKKKGKTAAARYAAAACTGYFICAFLHNGVTELLYGGTPAPFDLAGWLLEFCGDLWDESEIEWLKTVFDNVWEKLFGKRPFDTEPHEKGEDGLDWAGAWDDAKYNLMDDIPLVRNASNLLGYGDQSGPVAGVGEVFREIGSAGRTLKDQIFGGKEETGLDWAGAVKSAGMDLAEATTVFAPSGRQIRKTLQGTLGIAQGGKYKNFGENATLQYPVERNAWNAIRAGLFGLGALEETDEFYADGQALSKRQTQILKELEEHGVDRFVTYGLYEDFREIDDELTGAEAKNAKRDMIDALELDDEQKKEVYLRTMVNTANEEKTREKYEYLLERGVGWSQLTQLENSYALLNADEDGDGEADMSSLERGIAKRNEIASLDLTDWQKLEVYDRYHLQRDDDGYEETRAEFEAMLDEGLSWDEVTAAHNTHAELNAAKELNATQKATEYARWADQQDWTAKQVEAVKERYMFWQMIPAEAERYEKFVGAGLSADASDKMTKALDKAREKDGELKSLERYRVVVNAASNDKEALTALSTMMNEEQFLKIEIASEFGVCADDWVSFKENWLDRYGEDVSYNQSKVESILDNMPISIERKAALWQIANKSWEPKNNPYSTTVGQKVYDALN